MTPFLGELIGTALLILLGNGVVANVALNKTNGQDSGWIVITFGWGIAVFVGVLTVAEVSGAHINPAVTIGLAVGGNFPWADVPIYLLGQFLGGAIGASLVWLHYKDHFAATDDKDTQLSCFSTAPAIPNRINNLISEIIGTFVLVLAVFYITGAEVGGEPAKLGALDALPIALVVLGIGLSLGGTTGYAINPARDLSPRIMHNLLPIPNKRDSNWSYAWIPVVGPVIGATLAGLMFLALH